MHLEYMRMGFAVLLLGKVCCVSLLQLHNYYTESPMILHCNTRHHTITTSFFVISLTGQPMYI
jgi:hypothetical protein